MQFIASVGSEVSSFEFEAAIGTRMNRLLVRLGGFGVSVRVFGRWQGFHVEGADRGTHGMDWLHVGPFEATAQLPAWSIFKSRAAA